MFFVLRLRRIHEQEGQVQGPPSSQMSQLWTHCVQKCVLCQSKSIKNKYSGHILGFKKKKKKKNILTW